MKTVDIDGIFEKFLRDYMKRNAGKFSEEEWEDEIAGLYEKFGNTPLEELGEKSPVAYFDEFDGETLVGMLENCFEEKSSPSDFLCEAIIRKKAEKPLIALLGCDDEELLMTAINLLGEMDSRQALPGIFSLLTGGGLCDHVRELCLETLSAHADDVKERAIAAYNESEDEDRAYLCELLSRCSPDERVGDVLIDAFATHPDQMPFYAALLARFGDARAIPALTEAIEGDVGFNEFRELKFAIETLGGEYDKKRDFSDDAVYKKLKKESTFGKKS